MYESKKINNKKYDKMHIKQLAMSMKKEEAEIIQQNAQKYNMNTSLFCRKCIRYIIDIIIIYKGALYLPYNEI